MTPDESEHAELIPSDGVCVLHLFCHLPPSGAADGGRLVAAVKTVEAAGGQVVPVAMLGHKADVGLMALARDPRVLRTFQRDVQSAGLRVADSYVSLTEVSEYASGLPEEMKRTRLYPDLPPEGKRAYCFYPMSKRRHAGTGNNWYSLPYERRRELMYGHGKVGRTFAGRVLQLVTASTGLDDWEWGVTLFGVRVDDLKECVYMMRYDEGSARYAEFGTFYTGIVGDLEDVLDLADAGRMER